LQRGINAVQMQKLLIGMASVRGMVMHDLSKHLHHGSLHLIKASFGQTYGENTICKDGQNTCRP
jgi:hypothetical protein